MEEQVLEMEMESGSLEEMENGSGILEEMETESQKTETETKIEIEIELKTSGTESEKTLPEHELVHAHRALLDSRLHLTLFFQWVADRGCER